MKLSIGFSPCPNDTFIFDALIHHKIDTEGIEFNVHLEDVETLNHFAMQEKLDITKLSFHAYAFASENYLLLSSGSALGKGCGPLLISKDEIAEQKVQYCVIGIPGRFTTANLLLNIAYPDAMTKKELLFSEIEDALLNDEIDAGVIIHENRFTYQNKGLKKITDLGEFWEQNYHAHIPLGGIAIKRSIDVRIQQKINTLIRKSIEYAFQNPDSSKTYVKINAQEMEEHIIQQHINLYVNNFSIELGDEGKKSIALLYQAAGEKKCIPPLTYPIFI